MSASRTIARAAMFAVTSDHRGEIVSAAEASASRQEHHPADLAAAAATALCRSGPIREGHGHDCDSDRRDTVAPVEAHRSEEPQAVFAQPELPFADLEALDAIQRVELWLSSQTKHAADSLDAIAAKLYLADNATRVIRAERWRLVMEIHERCTHDWGVMMHGGPETAFLLHEAATGLVEGLWLSALLCSHAACERHLAGLLSMDEESLPPSWRSWGLGRLLEEARQRDAVPTDLHGPLETLNEVRKVSAHFKPPLHEGSLLNRANAMRSGNFVQAAGEISKADAFAAYETARSLMHRTTLA